MRVDPYGLKPGESAHRRLQWQVTGTIRLRTHACLQASRRRGTGRRAGWAKVGRRPPPDAADPALRLGAVAVGGALGTLARYAVSRVLAGDSLGFPWPTFAVNVCGSLLLGVLITVLVERWPPTRFLRAFAVVGFCGGFTTFSTMVVESAQRGQHGRAGLAALYLAASLIGGVWPRRQASAWPVADSFPGGRGDRSPIRTDVSRRPRVGTQRP